MKRFLLWIVGVALGVVLMLAAVMGVSYAFTTEGSCPEAAMQFGGVELQANGFCWQVPLIGAKLDKVFASPTTLTVQKLGTLYNAHPEIVWPEWAGYAQLTIQDANGNTVFEGSMTGYEDFLFPANGEYKADLVVWRLPEVATTAQFEGGSTGQLRKNAGLEHPARASGWYHYCFRFTLQADVEVELSAQRVEQGGVVGVRISGMTGDVAPTIETDLGSVQCVRADSGWRAYIPAAYNAYSGEHSVTITVGEQSVQKSIVVLPKDYGTVETEAEPAATEQANAEFRNKVWPLYEQTARDKMWQGGFICPAENSLTLVSFGQTKVVDGAQGSRSNSTKLLTVPGDACRAPAGGVVVLAEQLELTGNTVVVDHGCGVRSYLYGLQSIAVAVGQSVEKGQTLGALAEDLTLDIKIGSKSVNPWLLFQTSGGLFWQER